MRYELIKYKRIRKTHLVYLLTELATCFDLAGSSLGLYVNQVMLKNCVHLWDPIDVYKRWDLKDVHSFLTLLGSHKGLMMTPQG